MQVSFLSSGSAFAYWTTERDRAASIFGSKLRAALAGHQTDVVTLLPILTIPHAGALGGIEPPRVKTFGDRIF